MRKYVFVLAMLLMAGCADYWNGTTAVEIIEVRYDSGKGYGGETIYRTAGGVTGVLKGAWGQPGDTIYPHSRYIIGDK